MPTATVTPTTLQEADKSGVTVNTNVCHTGALIGSLPTPAQAAIILALTTESVSSSAIVRVLKEHGLPVRAENLNRHRRRLNGVGNYGCKCRLLNEAPQ